jgi:hypothetical protein
MPLRSVLFFRQIFKEISDCFSQAEVPLVYEVIPMLEDLEHQLDALRNDVTAPAVVRIAAQAALNVVGKYYALTDDCEVYQIAIGTSKYLLQLQNLKLYVQPCVPTKKWSGLIRTKIGMKTTELLPAKSSLNVGWNLMQARSGLQYSPSPHQIRSIQSLPYVFFWFSISWC